MAPAITRDPKVMHGTPVFRGTRVPIQTLLDYLEGGETLEAFLEGFPTVPREVALQALEEAKQLPRKINATSGDATTILHKLVLARIYHEDNVFVQRTYTFLTTHAFLATALTVLLSGPVWQYMLPIPFLLTVIGALMAGMQMLLGRQTNRCVGLWRQYCKAIESTSNVKLDQALGEFYVSAEVTTPFGVIASEEEAKVPIESSFLGHTSVTKLLGGYLPGLLFVFWGAAMFYVLFDQPIAWIHYAAWGVPAAGPILLILYLHKRPSHAEWKEFSARSTLRVD